VRTEWRGGLAASVASAAMGMLLGCKPPPPAVATTPMGRYEQAKQLHMSGHHVQAIGALENWLKANPKHPYEPAALYYLARSQVKAHRYEGAKATCQRLVKDHGDTEWGQFARDDLTTFDVKEPNLPEYGPRSHWWDPGDWFGAQQSTTREFELARKDYDSRRYEKALDAFRTLAKSNPTSPLVPAAWYFAARSQERLGQVDEARETYQYLATSAGDTAWKRLAEERLRRLAE